MMTKRLIPLCFFLSTLVSGSMVHAQESALKLRDLYNKDLSFSEYAMQHQSQKVSVVGFMAPPLKTDLPFFVLTKLPMSVCPFCETEADWPTDIVAIYTRKSATAIPYNVPIIVTGILELGASTDAEFGFVSRVRLVDASYKRK